MLRPFLGSLTTTSWRRSSKRTLLLLPNPSRPDTFLRRRAGRARLEALTQTLQAPYRLPTGPPQAPHRPPTGLPQASSKPTEGVRSRRQTVTLRQPHSAALSEAGGIGGSADRGAGKTPGTIDSFGGSKGEASAGRTDEALHTRGHRHGISSFIPPMLGTPEIM